MTIETISKNGYICELEYDSFSDYSLENAEIFHEKDSGIDLSNSKNYNHLNIGEKVDFDLPEFLRWLHVGDEYFEKEDCTMFKLFQKQYHYCKVYLYSHGGDTISTKPFSCRWDSGTAGIAFIKKTTFQKSKINGVKVRDNAEKREQLAMQYLNSKVEYADHYFTGSVYCFKIYHKNDSDDILDSCCGFVQDFSDFKKEAELEFNNFLENQKTNN